jgi:hypothetical protein
MKKIETEFMRTNFSITKSVLTLLFTVLITGCIDNSQYRKVTEVLIVNNGTDSTIYVEYGFLRPRTSNSRQLTDTLYKSRLTRSWYQFDDSQVNKLWLSEKDFNAYVSKIRIYMINKKDTMFVAPHFYNTKSAWTCHFENMDYDFGINFKMNQSELTILPTMFNK